MFILKFASIPQNVSELPQHDTQYEDCVNNMALVWHIL
jgi:hypothetical protein